MQIRELFRFKCHVKIRREDSDKQSDQPPASRPTQRADEQAESADNLCHTADRHKLLGRWEPRRNDSNVKARITKMVRAGSDEGHGGDEAQHRSCLACSAAVVRMAYSIFGQFFFPPGAIIVIPAR